MPTLISCLLVPWYSLQGYLVSLFKMCPKLWIIPLQHAVQLSNCCPYPNSAVVLQHQPICSNMHQQHSVLAVFATQTSNQHVAWMTSAALLHVLINKSVQPSFAHQMLAEVVSELADQLHKAKESICFSVLGSN